MFSLIFRIILILLLCSSPTFAKKKKACVSDQEVTDLYNKQRKGTPKDHIRQNNQFSAATAGLSKAQKRKIHDEISHGDYSYHDIKELADMARAGEF